MSEHPVRDESTDRDVAEHDRQLDEIIKRIVAEDRAILDGLRDR